MLRFLLLCWGWLLAGPVSFGQSVDCDNLGFEKGTFQGWELLMGDVSPSRLPGDFRLEPGSLHPENGQLGHVITHVSEGVDPNVRQQISVVAPGSQYSIRIGDLDAGGYVDQIRTTFTVSAQKPLLRYQFAVVLENPNHRYDRQPGFSLLIRTLAGDTISCGYYEAIATNQTAGFQYQERDYPYPRLIYRDWTAHVLDLRAYAGQTLRLEVTTHDCYEGGHLGYAYFDAQCLGMTPEATTSCTSQGTLMRLTVPAGFDRHQWSTGDTTATILVTPQLGATYWVDVESGSILNPTCRTRLRLTYRVDQLSLPTIQPVSVCAGEAYAVGDSIYRTPGTYRTVIRRSSLSCDSVVITHLTWHPLVSSVQAVTLCAGTPLAVGDSVYQNSGTYQTRVPRPAPLCDSIVTTHLTVVQVSLDTLRDTVVALGDSVQLTAPVPNAAQYDYRWLPPEGLSCSTCAVTWAKPVQTTQYQLTVQTPDGGCEASRTVRVEVVPCRIALPNTFTPNGDGVNDVFTVLSNRCLGRVRQLTVYNRWGQVLFHQFTDSALTRSVGWDGTYQGESVGTGIYPYQVQFESATGRVSKYSGALTLLR